MRATVFIFYKDAIYQLKKPSVLIAGGANFSIAITRLGTATEIIAMTRLIVLVEVF